MNRWLLLALLVSTPALADIAPGPPPTPTPPPTTASTTTAQPPQAKATLGEACQDKDGCVTGLRCKDGTCAEPAISYTTYKSVHVAAVLTLLLALGGLIFLSLSKSEDKGARRIATILHGLSLVLILVAGFGLMARLNIQHGEPWPNWIRTKFAMWAVIGAYLIVPKRLPHWNRFLWPAALICAVVSAAAAINKW